MTNASTFATFNAATRERIGAKLRQIREIKGISQLEVARKALGYLKSHAAVSRAERGLPGYFKAEVVAAMGAFYGITNMDKFIGDCVAA